ncbi:hypothetical protein CU048_05850 [Beijerinckiaceae bacterium]|nr:hypothetical protein CU048_05850 [Beijerinckiaceae bacterium]
MDRRGPALFLEGRSPAARWSEEPDQGGGSIAEFGRSLGHRATSLSCCNGPAITAAQVATPQIIVNVIDSKSLERDAGGKPVSTFPHPALASMEFLVLLQMRLPFMAFEFGIEMHLLRKSHA